MELNLSVGAIKRRLFVAGFAVFVLALLMMVLGTSAQATPAGDNVVLSEWTSRGPGGSTDEFVELYNADTVPVDISNWELRASDTVAHPNDDNPDYFVTPGTVLAPGDFWVIGAPPVPNVDQVVGVNDLWEDNNNALELITDTGFVVDTVIYPFPEETAHGIFSCTKSLTGTLIGIAIDRGLLASVDVPVVELLPEAAPEPVDELKAAMTVEDLLTMTSGLDCRDSDV